MYELECATATRCGQCDPRKEGPGNNRCTRNLGPLSRAQIRNLGQTAERSPHAPEAARCRFRRPLRTRTRMQGSLVQKVRTAGMAPDRRLGTAAGLAKTVHDPP